jgi:hypothetical protein
MLASSISKLSILYCSKSSSIFSLIFSIAFHGALVYHTLGVIADSGSCGPGLLLS